MFELPSGRPAIMAIINTTPDSFSDGGKFPDAASAVDAGMQLIEEGADLIDVGGESTRPGAHPVSADEEIGRIVPVIEGLAKRGIHVSVDTSKPEVARIALDAGAFLINDVNGLRAPGMLEIVESRKPWVCIMHMMGDPRSMQRDPRYSDVTKEVHQFLVDQAKKCITMGLEHGHIWIDPGLGFGKSVAHNCTLIRDLRVLVETGFPVLVGASRKSFLGKLIGSESQPVSVDARLSATLAAHVIAQVNGARILRVHDVRAAFDAVRVTASLLG